MSSEHPRDTSEAGFQLSRYFVEVRPVALVLLAFVLLFGVIGYLQMPKRKDPEIPVRVAVAIAVWPGQPPERMEQLLTRKIETKISENPKVDKVESTIRNSVAITLITLTEDVQDTKKEFNDIKLKLDTIADLPTGARPIQFINDFGDTVSLMLTLASPKATEVDVQVKAMAVATALQGPRSEHPGPHQSIVFGFPASVEGEVLRRTLTEVGTRLVTQGAGASPAIVAGSGFAAIDLVSDKSDDELLGITSAELNRLIPENELHPDIWKPCVVGDLEQTETQLGRVGGNRYSYRQLDDASELIQRQLLRVSRVSKVSRSGLLPEQITLEYSQSRLSTASLQPQQLRDLLAGKNAVIPGATMQLGDRMLTVAPTGEFQSEEDVGRLLVTASSGGGAIYLRDLMDIRREYQVPRFLNQYSYQTPAGNWQTSRAITLSVTMRSGEQINAFGADVNAALETARQLIPSDLVLARTSDQPKQVEESVSLFSNSLFEAIVLVVLVSLIGFWDFRSAALLALTIPITLLMTYAVMWAIGWDIQQISIATLILALGLLVDVPVVAGDAIKNELSAGTPPIRAAWLGPTKLAVTILFATLTNVVAYLPFLAVPGATGTFIRSLPVVMTIALMAAWLISLTFVPTLGYAILRPPKRLTASLSELKSRGFGAVYARIAGFAIDNRFLVFGFCAAVLVGGLLSVGKLRQAFFPKDLSYLSYVDVWLPEDASFDTTRRTAERAGEVVRETSEKWSKEAGRKDSVLESITTFVGGAAPRFWFSLTPELAQTNYAQLVINVKDKHATSHLVGQLQAALEGIPGAVMDVRQLESGKPVGVPVAYRISGEDPATLHRIAEQVKGILRTTRGAERVRDNWGVDALHADLVVDSDRANLSMITNSEIGIAAIAALNGLPVGQFRDQDRFTPIVARMRAEERSELSNLESLYIGSSRSPQPVAYSQMGRVDYSMTPEKLFRRNHQRTIIVSSFPGEGLLPSDVADIARPAVLALRDSLPPGYSIEVGGEEEEQRKGFANLVAVLLISVLCIFAALVIQFKSVIKPLIVFAAIPFGVVGAMVSLKVMGSPFGFMAFLGIISLIGVIVSHVIVLFDFIEERHEHGATLRDALIEAGVQRMRPVMITVFATVLALIPLAMHGGPLWEPLCFAQIGGLTIATFVTLLIVPVLYAICVKDLRIVRWTAPQDSPPSLEVTPSAASAPLE